MCVYLRTRYQALRMPNIYSARLGTKNDRRHDAIEELS